MVRSDEARNMVKLYGAKALLCAIDTASMNGHDVSSYRRWLRGGAGNDVLLSDRSELL